MSRRLRADEVSRYGRDGFHFPIRGLSPRRAIGQGLSTGTDRTTFRAWPGRSET